MTRLKSDIEGQTNTPFRQWLGTIEQLQWAQSFDEGFRYGQMTTNLVEGINAVLLKTRHLLISSIFSATFYRLSTLMPRMGQQQVNQMRFQTLHYLCAHVVATCAKVSLNVEQFVDDVYTLECNLLVWENEFPVLPDLSTWEVPPTNFELVLDKRLRRNPKGHPQSSRIREKIPLKQPIPYILYAHLVVQIA
ncbi:hypothetical protein GOBAR_DD12051 [Gossypium barbadense]|nr:hypothetical protein GOBAR_DD12051 [Gossypium barbadense]